MARGRPTKPKKRETLGDRIRRFRLAQDLTQTELGKQIGVSQRVITYYEVEGVSPPPELLVKIADTLDVSTDVLLGRKNPAKDRPRPGVESLRLRRRLKRIEQLPPQDRRTVLKMIDAIANEAARRKVG